MTYSKTLEITTDGTVENPIQVWIPIPKGSEYSIQVARLKPKFLFEKFGMQNEMLGKEGYFESIGDSKENIFSMVYLEIPNILGRYSINLEFEYIPKQGIILEPQQYWLNKGLEEDEVVDYNHSFVDELAKKIEGFSSKHKVTFSQMAFLYLARFLEYEESPQTRTASQVAKIMKSDCGGYHSLLCSLERYKGNPALLAFGFWGNMDEVYHTTAYVFEEGLWRQKDLNDQQDNRGILTPFVPISIGTDIKIETDKTPEFPSPVSFLQHSLVWIDGSRPKDVSKTFKLVQ